MKYFNGYLEWEPDPVLVKPNGLRVTASKYLEKTIDQDTGINEGRMDSVLMYMQPKYATKDKVSF